MPFLIPRTSGGGTLEIGAAVTGGTPYLVLFIGATGLLAQDADFSYDSTNDVLRTVMVTGEKRTAPTSIELPSGEITFLVLDAE